MTLKDDQREWLDKAIREKGRFTFRKSIEKDWGKYVQRREETANALAGIPKDHPDRNFIDQALKTADESAKKGRFNDAYKSLDSARKRAKAAVSERAKDIYNDEIRVQANIIHSYLGDSKKEVDFAVGHIENAVKKAVNHSRAGDETDFDKALEFLRSFLAGETVLRGDFESALKYIDMYSKNLQKRALASRFEQVEMDIKALQSAGRGKDIADQVKRVSMMKGEAESNDARYMTTSFLSRLNIQKKAEFEKAIRTIKSLEKWQQREGKSVSADEATDQIRSKNLNATENRKALIQREENRIRDALEQVRRENRADIVLKTDTTRGEVTLTPEPKQFDAGATFGRILGEGEVLPDTINAQEVARLESEAEQKLNEFLSGADPESDEMFDLSLKGEKEFQIMIAESLLGVTNPKKWTQSQKKLVDKIARKLETTLCRNLPNKMADDEKKITVNNVTYEFDAVLKEGGNGKARRYKDPNSGKTVVVKTLLRSSDEERRKMVKEMETHYRLMSGIDHRDTGTDAIVNMKGAARSSDGALHMVMEDVQGGDLEDVSAGLQLMQSNGIIPESARQILSIDMVAKTARGLMALERQGLVHHDIKGENVMMMSDGQVKIIDYGESFFGDEHGIVHGEVSGATDGYDAPEIYGNRDYDSKADTYSLAGMIQKLVANDSPRAFAGREYKSGSMARLINALKDSDPAKRPSLEAVLMSSLVQSGESDYAKEDVEELKAASAEFTNVLAKEKAEFDLDKAKQNLPYLDTVMGELTDKTLKLTKLQGMANYLEQKIADLRTNAKSVSKSDFLMKWKRKDPDNFPRVAIEYFEKQLVYLQNDIINKALGEKATKGQNAYQNAIDDRNKSVTFAGSKGQITLTLKDAVAKREQLVKVIADVQNRFYTLFSQRDNVDPQKLEELNNKLTEVDEYRKRIDTAIYEVMGPEAKFYLSKRKLEEVSKRFGTSVRNEPQEEIERDAIGELEDLLHVLEKTKEARAIKNAV